MANLSYPDNVIPPLRFQFCPMCTTELVREIIFDDGIPRVSCPKCNWIQLASNAAGVVVVAHNDDGIAAILPPNEDGIGLPAGLVEYGESPEEAAIREVYEETGLEVKIERSLGWFFEPYTDWPGPMIYFIYEAEVIGGALKGSEEGIARMFPLPDLPDVAQGRKGSQRALQIYLSDPKSGA